MLGKGLFRKPKNQLENYGQDVEYTGTGQPEVPDDMFLRCPECRRMVLCEDVDLHFGICPHCEYHFKIGIRRRMDLILDEGSFVEQNRNMTSQNIIGFPGYEKKLIKAWDTNEEPEEVVCGIGLIKGMPTAIFFMNGDFMMGSMGTIVGEKITRLFEYATEEELPVIGYTVSGGARMQEGILSLMQMAKTSGAVKRHSDGGGLYIAILTDPTTGGVTASFAMEGDIILAEPKALIGFAGPRVIEQTIRQKLPAGFQRAEFLLEKGFVDDVVDRREQRDYLANLLSLHSKEVRI